MQLPFRSRPFLQSIHCVLLPVAFLYAVLAGGCAAQTAKSYALSQVDKLDTELRRGVSTQADVLRLLGEPDGSGELAGFHDYIGPEPAQAWYYEDSKVEFGAIHRGHIASLLVYFRRNTYVGYYWFRMDTTGQWRMQ